MKFNLEGVQKAVCKIAYKFGYLLMEENYLEDETANLLRGYILKGQKSDKLDCYFNMVMMGYYS